MIHDVAKEDQQRINPMPNIAGKTPATVRQAFGTTALQFNGGATADPGYANIKDSRLYVNDGSTGRLVAGKLSDGSFGFQVSKPGKEVVGAGFDDLIFNSEQDNFKIAAIVDTIFGANSDPLNWQTIPHGLGFAPVVMGFLNHVHITAITANYINVPLPTFINASIGGVTAGVVTFATYATVMSDQDNVYLAIYNATGAPTPALPFRIYLLQESVDVGS